MKKETITTGISRAFGKTKFILKKHSPEILLFLGIGGMVVSAVSACRSTTKIKEVIDPAKEDLDIIHKSEEYGKTPSGTEYTNTDAGKDLVTVYTRTGWNLIKLYSPAIAIGALSITSLLASNNIMRKRNVALASAYVALDTSFKEYRKRVEDKYGEDVDKSFLYGTNKKKITEKVVDEDGKERKVKKEIEVVDENSSLHSPYARFFDSRCPEWSKSPDSNRQFLDIKCKIANDKLEAQGYLFLNDVYDLVGLPRTTAGQIVGWRHYKNPEDNLNGDNFVSFGIYECYQENERFINGYEPVAILDFNVDGVILGDDFDAIADENHTVRSFDYLEEAKMMMDGNEGEEGYYND